MGEVEIELQGDEIGQGEKEARAAETNNVVTEVDRREELGIPPNGEVGESAARAHQETAQVDEDNQPEVGS